MSERHFRIIMGLWLIAGLYLNSAEIIYAFLATLLFEGITNFRIPKIISKIRYGQNPPFKEKTSSTYKISFEAERALRFIVAAFVATPFLESLHFFWWLPWFVGFALIGAGLSGICPMVLALRYAGFK